MAQQTVTSPGAVAISESVAHGNKTPSTASMLTFFALAFAWSWTFWLLAPALKADFPVTSITMSLMGGFGPSLAALVIVACSSGTAGLRRWLQRRLRWRVGWRWVALAFLFPVVFMGLAAAIHVALGGSLPPSPAVGHVGLAAASFLLVFLVGGPLGEEFG